MVDAVDKSSENAIEFQWTAPKEMAAVLVAQDEKSDALIASEVGISVNGLRKWKGKPAFQDRVKSILDGIRKAVRSHGIAVIENRVIGLQRRHDKLNQIVAERSEDPEMALAPGGKTGLLAIKLKSIGSGMNAEVVKEYEVDTGLLAEFRAIEKQAAQELGQWDENLSIKAKVETVNHDLAVARNDAERQIVVDAIVERRAQQAQSDQAPATPGAIKSPCQSPSP